MPKRTKTRKLPCASGSVEQTQEQRQWCRSGVFIVNFQHVSHVVLAFLLLTLNMQMLTAS